MGKCSACAGVRPGFRMSAMKPDPLRSPDTLNRRDFISATAMATAGALVTASVSAQDSVPSPRKRYALVGVGSRSEMYRTAVLRTYPAHAQMVGYCDNNRGRLQLAQRQALDSARVEVPIYDAKDFDRMIRETKPDVIIVTTKDATHSQYIIRAMELGCDVMTEKPMTTDEKKCRDIFAAQKKTGRKIVVTFNYRYSPHRT